MRYLHTLDRQDLASLIASENEVFEDEPKDEKGQSKTKEYGDTDKSGRQALRG